jgi:hypothetical protein
VVDTKDAAANRSHGVQMVTDSLRTIFARMDGRLGHMTTKTAEILQQWYEQPSEYDTIDYFRIANELHEDLGPSGNQLTDNQRATAYRNQRKLRPEVGRVLDMFDYDHPDEHTHTLAMLEAYILSKEAFITKGMTRKDVYPSSQGMSAASAPIADAPTAPADSSAAASDDHSAYSVDHPTAKLYTHEQLAIIALQAVQTALSAAISQPPAARGNNGRRVTASHTYESPNRTPTLTHCYHHGLAGTAV